MALCSLSLLSLTSDSSICGLRLPTPPAARKQVLRTATGIRRLATRAGAGLDSNDEVGGVSSSSNYSTQLQPGSAVIVTVAPPFVKTADPMPMLRPNDDIVREGDAGRVVGLRPKGQLAVRFRIGTYLLDRKNVAPLNLDQNVSDTK